MDAFSSNSVVRAMGTIAANNVGADGSDLAGSTITSLGHNLFSVGASGATNTDLQGVDPKLGPLQDNGGPTWTHALLAGSPAIDAGVSGGLAFDQRSQPRTIDIPAIPNAFGGDGTDIGALEVDPVLRFTEVRLSGTNVLLKFTTVSDKAYAIQSRSGAVGGAWTPVPGLLAGTGGIVTMTNDLPPSVAARYYRAVAQPP